MTHLHQAIAEHVNQWRSSGYACEEFPAISEMLDHAFTDEEGQQLRFLRVAQFKALETYWYLRLIEQSASIPELYKRYFEKSSDRRQALGLNAEEIRDYLEDEGWNALYERIKTDNAFVRQYKLESLRETLTLQYPSYILALAMGAGKTILIGTIIATEFAMAQEYPDGPFVQNALVFAPGKTIIESLRELSEIPFDRILPPRMLKPFSATLKLTFTRDGDSGLPITLGSLWNIIVTNTEKIRIQKKTRRANSPQLALQLTGKEDHDEEIANKRLRAIASLPHLAVFSDEAHHTYGQKLLGKWETNQETGEQEFKELGIKKVRKTVDFLAEETNLVVVVNTTGTPYFERQPLRDVVVWYGLGEGIKDGILKQLANNIQIFDLDEDNTEHLLERIIEDFVKNYWDTRLPDGAPARIALYFPNTQALDELRPAVDSTLAKLQQDTACVLAVHSKSSKDVKQEFYRIANDANSPYRIILLVNMGTEGWNCPSPFACGLVRKLKTSNNFVLQAATRCLRQVPGNMQSARVYVSKGNKSILAKQLEETFGTSIQELNNQQNERIEQEIVIRKPEIPPILIKKQIIRFRRKAASSNTPPLTFTLPDIPYQAEAHMETWTIAEPRSGATRLTRIDGGEDKLEIEPMQYSLHGAVAELSTNYHIPASEILKPLTKTYGDQGIPEHHLPELGKQIEQQRSDYEKEYEEIDVALALIKPEGFEKKTVDGETVYTARISFSKEREHLYKLATEMPDTDTARDYSFHYEGYNFDSNPEAQYLERVLNLLQQNADQIEGIWFTGGLSDPNKTELYAEYLGEDNRWHRYSPDFVIQRKDGKHLVVEVKKDAFSNDILSDLQRLENHEEPTSKEGRKAVALKRWENLNPDTLQYEVIFANDELATNALDNAAQFIKGA